MADDKPEEWTPWVATRPPEDNEGVVALGLWVRVRPRYSSIDKSIYWADFQITGWNDTLDGPDELYTTIEGDLKWDGCHNWQAGQKCMVHGCGIESIDELKDAFRAVWQKVQEISENPHWGKL